MPIYPEYITFLFGAGASTEFGIPSMRKMTEHFKNEVEQQNSMEEQMAYNEIIEILKEEMGPEVDIEAVFSVIDGLQEYNVENIGELSLYASKKLLKDTLLHKRMDTPSKSTLKSLETSFQQFIRKSCKLESKYRQRMVDTYTSFFNSIAKAINSWIS